MKLWLSLSNSKTFLAKNKKYILILTVFFVLAAVSGYLMVGSKSLSQRNNVIAVNGRSPEIEQIKNVTNIDKQSQLYLKLIKRVGAEQAQEELQNSGLPYTGNTHLLNHTVGNHLYSTYGAAGVLKCKDYFSASCYHGVIINALGNNEQDEINNMMEECRKAGKSVFSQCAHALGHGFLPWLGYANLPQALERCDEMGKTVEGFDLMLCHSGVFMENNWGVHGGSPSPDRYHAACWYNQYTPLWHHFQGNMQKVADVCLTVANKVSQENCFAGLFNALQITSNNNIDKQFEECNRMPREWKTKCITTQISVGFSQGDKNTGYKICERIEPNGKEECYKKLNENIIFYSKLEELNLLCEKVPTGYRAENCSIKKF
jgi:hypothetical protein